MNNRWSLNNRLMEEFYRNWGRIPQTFSINNSTKLWTPVPSPLRIPLRPGCIRFRVPTRLHPTRVNLTGTKGRRLMVAKHVRVTVVAIVLKTLVEGWRPSWRTRAHSRSWNAALSTRVRPRPRTWSRSRAALCWTVHDSECQDHCFCVGDWVGRNLVIKNDPINND